MTPATILPVVAAVVAAVGAFMVARRQYGGRIQNSEAAELWEESRAIRNELRAEVLTCRSEVQSLRSEILSLRERLT